MHILSEVRSCRVELLLPSSSLQVFGNVDRLGELAARFTASGWVQANVEVQWWIRNADLLNVASGKLMKVDRSWLAHRLRRYPGLQVPGYTHGFQRPTVPFTTLQPVIADFLFHSRP